MAHVFSGKSDFRRILVMRVNLGADKIFPKNFASISVADFGIRALTDETVSRPNAADPGRRNAHLFARAGKSGIMSWNRYADMVIGAVWNIALTR